MAKQLSIRKLPVNSCPISRGPPWPRQPASCPALLLTRHIFTEKLTLPGTEAPLHQHTGLVSHGLTAALRPSCSTGGLWQYRHLAGLQKHTASFNCATSFRSTSEYFWWCFVKLKADHKAAVRLSCCWGLCFALCYNHTDSVQHFGCFALYRAVLRLHSKLFSGGLKAMSPRVAAQTSCLPETETLESQGVNVI